MSSSDEPNHTMRLIHSPEEEGKLGAPIWGYQKLPLVTLEEATKPLQSIVKGLQNRVTHAKDRCKDPPDNLTPDESASIYLYTSEWSPSEDSFYYILNKALRDENRISLKPWFLYLKLFMTALSKLPSRCGVFHRGVTRDIRVNYPDGRTFVWWSFTSCTLSPNILEKSSFLGKTGDRTLFKVSSYSAKDIGKHSNFIPEQEVLLPAGRLFTVKGSMNAGDGLSIIHVEEIEPEYPLLEPVSSSFLGPTANAAVKITPYNNPKLEKVIQRSECENLDLTGQELNDQDMGIVVAKGVIEKRSTKLNLMYNDITPAGVSVLADGLRNKNSSVKVLILSQNRISDPGVRSLAAAAAMTNSTLESLDLSENDISDEGATYLAEMIEKNAHLVELILEQNTIGNEGVKMFAKALAHPAASLQVLILRNNRKISNGSVEHFTSIMENNQSLQKIDVRGCSLSKEGEAKLQQVGKLKRGFKIWLSHFL